MKTIWTNFTVKELKEYLGTAGLIRNGNKADLIARIIGAEPPASVPNWAEMELQEIKRYLKVYPTSLQDFMTFLNN